MDTPNMLETGDARPERPEDKIALWTSLGHKERVRSIGWFASRPMPEQVRIIADSESLLPRLRQMYQHAADDEHVRYAAFILAIRGAGFDLTRKRGYRVHGHKNFAQFEALRQGTLASLKRGKKAPLRQEVLALWGEVSSLRMQGNGFRLISRYLLRAHKLKVSASYLVKLWKELEA